MECLVDESYQCKSGNISSTLDCKDSGCCHFLKISEYERSKLKIQAIYADTWIDLTVKMLGYHHDHCWHLYAGRNENVPENLKKFVTENYQYVFLYEEDEPLKP